ncbi:response regulator [Ramlibacter sp. MAHUQ-53]|uniref:response regulator n=1 Tax=unclassified Ramlibacter TaxID=2617605 RepID=UPI00363D2CCB
MTPRARPPLFRRPGAVVLLDDDADYLEMLAMVLPRHWPLRLFTRPTLCVHAFHRELKLWEADRWQVQYLVDLWRQGKPLLPQILGYWARATERYGLTQVCVVDFSMPAMDGLQVLSELVDWPGARVLLTGQADERVAVHAFNRRLIDHYIPKQAPNIALHLIETLDMLAQRACERFESIIAATLSPAQHALLRAPGVPQALEDFIRRRWIEHMVIGDPFGVLGMDAAGRIGWLQFETREGLAAQAELAELEGLPPPVVAEIRCGHRLANLELRQGLDRRCGVEHGPAFALGDEASLLAALFNVQGQVLAPAPASYESWLAQQPPRAVPR